MTRLVWEFLLRLEQSHPSGETSPTSQVRLHLSTVFPAGGDYFGSPAPRSLICQQARVPTKNCDLPSRPAELIRSVCAENFSPESFRRRPAKPSRDQLSRSFPQHAALLQICSRD